MLCIAAMVLAAEGAWAVSPDLRFEQLHHAQWTFKDGAPTSAWSLAQTPDGVFWIGASDGLHTFDGRTFRLYRPPGEQEELSTPVNALWVARNGALWVSLNGWLLVIEGGKAQRIRSPFTPYTFAHGPDGRVWGANRAGVHAFQAGAWESVAERYGIPARPGARQLITDPRGSLWLTAAQGLFVLDPGSTRFERVRNGDGAGALVFTATATLLTTEQGLAAVRGAPGEREVVPIFPLVTGLGAMLDRDGSLWLGAGNDLARIPRPDLLEVGQDQAPAQLQRFSRVQGLSGDLVNRLFEDREGNIWATTNGGIDRFRATKLTRLVAPDAYSAAWAPDPDGSMWAATRAGRLYRIADDMSEVASTPGILSMARDERGRLWIGGLRRISRLEQGRLQDLPLPPGAQGDVHNLVPMAGDAMLAILRGRAHFWKDERWQDSLPFPDIANAISATRRDRRGQIWIGQPDGRIQIVGDKGVTRLPPPDPSNPSPVLSFAFDERLTWIGTDTGLYLYDGQAYHRVAIRDGPTLRLVAGLEFADDGALWIGAAREIAIVSPAELERLRNDPSVPIALERLDHHDGLEGTPPPVRPVPTVAKTRDGRLWFSTVRGLFVIDPKHIRRNPVAPSLAILAVEADGRARTTNVSGTTELAAGTRQLRVRFTAFSLAMPDRVQFKYRLEGVDPGWVPAGAAREASYANLGPGRYAFSVQAANEDGVWNETGATTTLVIPPRFHQTSLFWWIVALAGAALLWGAHRLRLQIAANRLREELMVRYQERSRIARELHDTLLQGIQGLILTIQSFTERMATPDQRAWLQRSLDHAERLLVEGRDQVHDLRDDADEATLFDAIQAEMDRLRDQSATTFELVVSGDSVELAPRTNHAVRCIAVEALRNAAAHSRARSIRVDLDWSPSALQVVVTDDGIGLSRDVLNDRPRPGHWGLSGMRERAEQLGATLTFSAGPDGGTAVRLAVPMRGGRGRQVTLNPPATGLS